MNLKMRMEQIRQVIAIAGAGSISKAAAELYISQPSLSVSLQNLEREIGQPLFQRCGKGVELTPFGSEFLAYAQNAYHQFRMLESICERSTESPRLTLSVASQYLKFAHSLFMEMYHRYKTPYLYFAFSEGSLPEVLDAVRLQEAEIGVLVISRLRRRMMQRLFVSSGVECAHLSTQHAAVIVGKHNPLYTQKDEYVTSDQLAEYPMVVYKDVNYGFATEWEQLGLGNPKKRIVVSDRATMNEFIANTDAYTVAVHNKKAYVETAYYDDRRPLYLSDRSLELDICCITNKSRPLSVIAKEYVSELKRLIAV
jgi:DNA-binding transcriptional LysR family regulator